MGKIDFAVNEEGNRVGICSDKLNRHGFIAGATGTGKTVSLKVLAERFSDLSIPVFLSDFKGDLSGLYKAGVSSEKLEERKKRCGLTEAEFSYRAFPVNFFSFTKEGGIPLRTTVSEMGPLLLSRILGLSDVQGDILRIIFCIADEEGLLLLDLKDLRAMLRYISENNKDYEKSYGKLSTQSLNAILRSVVALEDRGGAEFFGEPAIDVRDFFRVNAEGKGVISILDAKSVASDPTIYSTFLLYLLSELYENLPEVGDLEKPRMVFFFDEAHLLFQDCEKALLEKITQVTRLIRSKGIGIYYVSQNPADIPESILSQLGNKIQHGLSAYTPEERKKLKAVADSFRENPSFDTLEVLENLGTGEALVSCLTEDGKPMTVEKVMIFPPQSFLGEISPEEKEKAKNSSDLAIKYDETVDRDSAYEMLERKGISDKEEEEKRMAEEERVREEEKNRKGSSRAESRVVKSVGRSVSGAIGREVGYSVGKAVFGKGIGRRLGGNIGAALGRGILETLFGK